MTAATPHAWPGGLAGFPLPPLPPNPPGFETLMTAAALLLTRDEWRRFRRFHKTRRQAATPLLIPCEDGTWMLARFEGPCWPAPAAPGWLRVRFDLMFL